MAMDIHEIARLNVERDQRIGQAYFNAAYEMDSVWTNEIRATELDPFYRETRLGEFLTKWEIDHA